MRFNYVITSISVFFLHHRIRYFALRVPRAEYLLRRPCSNMLNFQTIRTSHRFLIRVFYLCGLVSLLRYIRLRWLAVSWTKLCFYLFGCTLFQINDWPDLKFRGVLWDVSTGRVPTLVGASKLAISSSFFLSCFCVVSRLCESTGAEHLPGETISLFQLHMSLQLV